MSTREKKIHRFIEFLIVGLAMGITEDIIAVKLATGAEINLSVIWVVLLIAIPFAVFSELIVDREDFDFGLIEKKLKDKFRE